MKKSRSYTGFLTVMAFVTITCFSPGCGESYPNSGSGNEAPELGDSDRAAYMAPANAFAGNQQSEEKQRQKGRT